jgi:hypothetical protein
VRLLGIPLTEDDCKTLVDLLHRVGRADDLELAQRIDANLERRAKVLGLSPGEQRIVLAVLDDAPVGSLSELRGQLMKDLPGHKPQMPRRVCPP